MRVHLYIGLALLLTACAHQPPPKPAPVKPAPPKAPVLITDKSLNPFKISFTNTAGKPLVSLDLVLAFYGADGRPAKFGDRREAMWVRLNGAFARDKSYAPYPSSGYMLDGDNNVRNLDFTAGPGGAMPDLSYDTDQGKATPACFVIERVDVHYANGTVTSLKEHLSDALAGSVRNRC